MISSDFVVPVPGWLRHSRCEGATLWSTIALERNIAGERFPQSETPGELGRILKEMTRTMKLSPLKLDDVDISFRKMLQERLYISNYQVSHPVGSALQIMDVNRAIRLNAESHFTFLSIQGEMADKRELGVLIGLTEDWGEHFPFAYSERFGYLNPSIKHCGTGLIISSYLFLPGFILAGELSELRFLAREKALRISPFLQDDMHFMGAGVFILQNLKTIGTDIENLFEETLESLSAIERKEHILMNTVMEQAEHTIVDRVMKTIGMLKYARELGDTEIGTSIFSLLLGAQERIIDIDPAEICALFFSIRNGYLELEIKEREEELSISEARAEAFQNILQRM